MGWGARLSEKERGESVDSSLCFLTAETMSPAASLPPACLPYHDRLHPLKPRAILPLSAFDRNVITVMRKMTSIPFSIILGSTVLGGRFHISVPHLTHGPDGWAQLCSEHLPVNDREIAVSCDKPTPESGLPDILGEEFRVAVKNRDGQESPAVWKGPEHKARAGCTP